MDRRSASFPRLPKHNRTALLGPFAHVTYTPYPTMSGESNMDEVEIDIAHDVDGDIGTDDAVSNGDLANRRRRQQVRQACQQCRRRKIKVQTLPASSIDMHVPNLTV